MSDHSNTPAAHYSQDAPLAPPPDESNPALIDAEHAFVITLISAALFVGAVFIFIL